MKLLRTFLTPKHNKDSLPLDIIQKRVFILPTKSGVLFCSMLFVMFLVSLNNNNNLGLLLTFLLASMFLISMIYTHSNLLGLKILSINSKPIFSGEKLEITCSVFSANITRPLVSFNLQNQAKTFVSIEQADRQKVQLNAENLNRGIYYPKTITVETEFPFSFFRAWTFIKTDMQCLVYPKPLAHSNPILTLAENSATELNGESVKGNEDFDGLKNYQQGDSLKQIYWKGFSRGGGLHSKTYCGGKSDVLLFDFENLNSDDLEKRLSMLSYSIIQANKDGSRFALKLPNIVIGPEAGESHVQNCLKALALYGGKNA